MWRSGRSAIVKSEIRRRRRRCKTISKTSGSERVMEHPDTGAVPSGHTKGGGVLIGSDRASRQLVLFEDPQCPYCRQFEEASGELLRRLVETEAVAIEYRMRCFLGVESVRADNALALAAEAGRFDELRRQMFADQPAESTGGYTVDDLIDRGRQVWVCQAELAPPRSSDLAPVAK